MLLLFACRRVCRFLLLYLSLAHSPRARIAFCLCFLSPNSKRSVGAIPLCSRSGLPPTFDCATTFSCCCRVVVVMVSSAAAAAAAAAQTWPAACSVHIPRVPSPSPDPAASAGAVTATWPHFPRSSTSAVVSGRSCCSLHFRFSQSSHNAHTEKITTKLSPAFFHGPRPND